MCRPSCCRQPSHEGAGLAAIAVIIGGAFAYAKIGPAVARIWHIAVEVLTIVTLIAASAAVAIVVTCATARIIGSRRAHRPTLPHPLASAADPWPVQESGQPGCLACGGTGTVLRAITANDYRADACPVCAPAEWAG